MRIDGSAALVTGATGGIGDAIARALAAKGAGLLLTGRRADALETLAKDLDARTDVADLADPAQVERLAGEAGDVGILVANAALPSSGALLDYTPEQIDRALQVNLHAPIMLCRLLAPRMVEAGRGHLVLVGSLSGKVSSSSTSLYNAAKFGLRGFAHALRQDLHGTGVGVSIVQPGFVRDAGMFADTGTKAPTRTVSPGQVAAGVVRAIERDRAEVNVAPLEIRAASAIAGQFPGFAARLQRRLNVDDTTRQIVEAQRDKR